MIQVLNINGACDLTQILYQVSMQELFIRLLSMFMSSTTNELAVGSSKFLLNNIDRLRQLPRGSTVSANDGLNSVRQPVLLDDHRQKLIQSIVYFQELEHKLYPRIYYSSNNLDISNHVLAITYKKT